MIQFAQTVGLENPLASYGMMEDVLLTANAGYITGPVPHRVDQSLFPIQCGSIVFESALIRCRPLLR